jgi:hypothetical protein
MKVKVPREIAKYIEDLLIGSNRKNFILGVLAGGMSPKYAAVRKHFEDDLDSLLNGIVDGFEVEETPEERILESYHRKMASANNPCASNWKNAVGFADGIKFTLNELGIKIEGVNS